MISFILRKEVYDTAFRAIDLAVTIAHTITPLRKSCADSARFKYQANFSEVVRQIYSRPIDGQTRVSCSDGKWVQIVTRITWPKQDYHNRQFWLPKKLAIPMLEESGFLHQV